MSSAPVTSAPRELSFLNGAHPLNAGEWRARRRAIFKRPPRPECITGIREEGTAIAMRDRWTVYGI